MADSVGFVLRLWLKPSDVERGCDGIARDFAHARWSSISDVVVHQTAPVALPEACALLIACSTGPGEVRRRRVSPSRAVRIGVRVRACSQAVRCSKRKSRVSFAKGEAFNYETEIEGIAEHTGMGTKTRVSCPRKQWR